MLSGPPGMISYDWPLGKWSGVTHLVVGVPRVDHDDGTAVVLKDHAPQVDDGVRLRHLCHDVLILALVALSHTRTYAHMSCIYTLRQNNGCGL